MNNATTRHCRLDPSALHAAHFSSIACTSEVVPMSFFNLTARSTLPMAEDEGLLQPSLSEIQPPWSKEYPVPTRSRSQGIRDLLAPTKIWLPWLVAGVFALSWLRLYMQQVSAALGSYEMGFTSDLCERYCVQISWCPTPDGSLQIQRDRTLNWNGSSSEGLPFRTILRRLAIR